MIFHQAGGFGEVLAKFKDLGTAQKFSELWIQGHSEQTWELSTSVKFPNLAGLDQNLILQMEKVWEVPNSQNLLTGEGPECLILAETG